MHGHNLKTVAESGNYLSQSLLICISYLRKLFTARSGLGAGAAGESRSGTGGAKFSRTLPYCRSGIGFFQTGTPFPSRRQAIAFPEARTVFTSRHFRL
jgi:hypothetical protein